MTEPKDPKAFSPLISKILLDLARVLVPLQDEVCEGSIEADQAAILRDCGRIVFEMPPMFKMGFKIILRLFNILPFAFGFGFKKFISLDADSQIKYVDSWAQSKREIFRETTKAFKGLIMVVCFSNKKIYQMLDYDPVPYIQDRVKHREELMRNTPTVGTN